MMIRISFSKIEFYKNTSSQHAFIEVESETSQIFKINRKKITNNVSRFYGDFFQVPTNNYNLLLKIYQKEDKKADFIIQKLNIQKKTYGLNLKSSHVLQGKHVKIYFDSQIINYQFSDNNHEQTINDLSQQYGTKIYSPRLSLIKGCRQYSLNKLIQYKKRKNSQDLQTKHSKNSKNSSAIQSIYSSESQIY